MIYKIKRYLNNKEKKQLLTNLLSLSFLKVFTYALPLLTIPYLVNVLGTEKFGLVMFAQATMVYFSMLVDFGFDLSATREISINRDNKEKITEIFSSVVSIKVFLIFLTFLLMIGLVSMFNLFSKNWELYFFSFLLVPGQAMFPTWYFQGMEKMKYITIINIFIRVLFTILIFFLIQKESDYIYVPIINGLGYILGGGISLIFIYKNFNQNFKFYSFKILKKYFKDSFDFFLSRISVSLYTTSNIFLLGIFTNNIQVGYYSIAEKIYNALQQSYSPLVQSLYPYFAKQKNILFFKKIFYTIIIINLLVVALLFALSQEVFELLFSAEISTESLNVFAILLIANIGVVPSILLGYPFLGAIGLTKETNLSIIVGAFVHVLGLGCLVLFGKLSIYPVAFMVILTEFTILSVRVFFVKKHSLWKRAK